MGRKKHHLRSCLSILLCICMVLQFGGIGGIAKAKAEPDNYVLNKVGTVSGTISVNGVALTPGSAATVDYGPVDCSLQWTLPDGFELHLGDTLTYELPENLDFTGTSGSLMNGGQSVGTYEISGHRITLKYTNEAFLTEGGRRGALSFSGTLSKNGTNNQNGGETEFRFPGVGTFPVTVNRDPSNDGVTITKDCSIHNGNPFERDYVLTVSATGSQSNVTVTDTMGEYLSMDSEVTVYTDSACTAPYSGGFSVNRGERGFTCTIDKMQGEPQTLYVKYTAKVDQRAYADNNDWNNQAKYKNTASVVSDEDSSPASADKGLPTQMTWGNKSGQYNADRNTITWTVNINQNNVEGVDIAGTVIQDVPGTGLGTPENVKVSVNYKDATASQTGLVAAIQSGSAYTFPAGSTGIYSVSYETAVPEADPEGSVDYANTMQVVPFGIDDFKKEYPARVTVGTPWDYVEKECVTKGNSDTVEWQAVIHVPTAGIADCRVTDVIPAGMTYEEGSLNVEGLTPSEVSGTDGKLSFALGTLSKGDYKVTYKTKINPIPDVTKEYVNRLTVYDGTQELDTSSDKYTYSFAQYLSTEASYDAADPGCVRWKLNIAPVGDAATVVITDTLPENMSYAGGMQVFMEGWNDQTAQYASDIEVIDNEDGTVSIKITGELLNQIKTTKATLNFQTKPTDGLEYVNAGNKEYINKAHLTVDEVACPDVSASRWVNPQTNLVNKSSDYTGSSAPYVHYSITVNPEALDLIPDSNTLEIKDTFRGALSFHRGTLLINGTPAAYNQYSYDSETKVLRIWVPDSAKVEIKYDALLNLEVGTELNAENASNACELVGVMSNKNGDSDALGGSVLESIGSSSSNGVMVVLYKYGRKDKNVALKGARFTVTEITVDADGNETGTGDLGSKSASSDANGYVYFSGLLRGHYYKIVETGVPAGYVADLTPIYFRFLGETEDTDRYPSVIKAGGQEYPLTLINKTASSYTFEHNNESVNGQLVITKTLKGDVTKEEAEGALTFRVTNTDDKSFHDYTLADFEEADGKYTLTLNDTAIGNYTVEETTRDITGKTVTVKYSVNSGSKTEGSSVNTTVNENETTTVNFENTYTNEGEEPAPEPETGTLVIKKTISGDVTEEEYKGALKFKVTKNADGTYVEYTLDKFTKVADKKYTLTLDEVVGGYTVEETTSTIDGYTVTVKHSVGSGDLTEGASADATVTKDGTTTVAFEDSYERVTTNLKLEGEKTLTESGSAKAITEGQFSFTLEAADNNPAGATLPEATTVEVAADGTFVFGDITFDRAGTYVFTVSEVNGGATGYTYDDKAVTVTVPVTLNTETNELEVGTVTYAKGSEEATGIAFANTYTAPVVEAETGTLVIKKTIKGDVTKEEAEGALKFKVTNNATNESTEYTLSDFKDDGNGEYTLELVEVVGGYTVEETTFDVSGHSVTVTYSVDGGTSKTGTKAETAVTADGETTVAFEDNYVDDKGNLVITKTINGDVTEEEAEGALKFKVTKNADGTYVEYTLDKFTKVADKKYTLTLDEVVGGYTVEETTSTIDGYTVTVKHSVGSGDPTEGASADATVIKDGTTTVAFEDSYERVTTNLKLEGEKTLTESGSAKAITEGQFSFTLEAADNNPAGATLPEATTAEVAADGTFVFGDITFDRAGTYVFTVSEVNGGATGYTYDDKAVTVTVPVTLNTETNELEVGTVTYAKGSEEATGIAFANTYTAPVVEAETGTLVIKKTIKGDVTEEEAEGALKFKVTNNETNESTEYTLSDFKDDGNGEYTLELKTVIGGYTVEETTYDVDGHSVTVTNKVNGGEAAEGTEAKAEVTKDATTTVDFEDDYADHKGTLVITKTIKGDVTEEEAEGALKFKVTNNETGEEKTYTLKDFTKGEDGVYTLELETVIGGYTVEETTYDVDGHSVTVTHKVGDEEATEGASAEAAVTKDNTTTVAFEDDYVDHKGTLVITKTIKGDVTEEEAEGALTFKVTNNETGEEKTYTLKDFTKGEDGVYTLELETVIGGYTVEETTYDVDGHSVTVTHKVGDEEATEGASAEATVSKDNTTTVVFEDDYVDHKGTLVITKTIKGDVTEEEAEGALKFQVTNNDTKETKTYTLTDFTKGEDGKYTLELETVIGGYTVEETTYDVDGHSVTVTHKVGDEEATEGASAEATVSKDNTTTVVFEDDYVDHKGKLVITKTIKGDVTEEEAEGALTFKVTNNETGDEKTYTLKDFTKGEDGKYTLELETVIGGYTVEETTSDIDGCTVTVTHRVDGGKAEEGTKAETIVMKDNKTMVEFEDDYEAIEEDMPSVVSLEFDGTGTLTENGKPKNVKYRQFRFFVSAGKNNPAEILGLPKQEIGVKEDGSFDLGKLTFTKEGKYTFTISEVNGGVKGYTYDEEAITVTVEVVRDEKENKLVVKSVKYEKNGKKVEGITFENTYKTSSAAANNTTNNANSTASKNDKVQAPVTGDNSNIALWIMLMAASLTGVIGSVLFGFRRKEENEGR